MKRMHSLLKMSLSALCFAGWLMAAQAAAPQTPKYIFLLIGDGMGVQQRASAEMYKRITTGSAPNEEAGKLVMNRLPRKGLTTTQPADSLITDSAAAATAIACGHKTKNGRIAVSSDSKVKFTSIAYDAKRAGMKVGIISSVPIDHATPAAFYANEGSRGNYYEISVQAAASGFNYFAGQTFRGDSQQQLKGRVSPEKIAEQAGYASFHGQSGRTGIRRGMDKVIWQNDLPLAIDSTEGMVTLKELTQKGIELLENENGFFIMIEGGKIDWSGHSNDLATNIKETLAFDQAVQQAYDFYLNHPEETLIVITGDHETGGLTTSFTGNFSPDIFVASINGQKTSGQAFAAQTKKWNPQHISADEALTQVCDTFGIAQLTPKETAELNKVIAYTLTHKTSDTRPEELKQMYGSKNMIANASQTIIARRCGITWTTFGHSGAAVMTTAIGPCSEQFAGQTDNTDIAKKLRKIIR